MILMPYNFDFWYCIALGMVLQLYRFAISTYDFKFLLFTYCRLRVCLSLGVLLLFIFEFG